MSDDNLQIGRTRDEVAAVVGPEHIRAATSEDIVDDVQPVTVIEPGSAQQIAQVLRCCDSAGVAVIPRGGGTKLGLGNRPRKADFVLSTRRLNRVLEHAWDDMTTTVEAGCTAAELQRVLKEHGQYVAFDPMHQERATIGGILATGESGTLRIRYGALRDLVLGVEMALPDGSVIKAGGKVVKNVAGYDLTKLAIGSLGTIGVITRAVFRLHPIPVATITYSAVLSEMSDLAELLLAILDSNLVYTGLQVRARHRDQLQVDLRFEGIPDSLHDQHAKLTRMAGAHEFKGADADVWSAQQKLFTNAQAAIVCRCSVQPAQLASLCDVVFGQVESAGATASMVAQGTGLAEVRLDAGSEQAQLSALNSLRAGVQTLGGTLVVQHCPAQIKRQLDIWGPVKALPLMHRIKEQFDPARTLNPGRFVGGI